MEIGSTFINVSHRFKVVEDILAREVEGEVVLLDIPGGIYYALNQTALPLWETIRDGKPLETALERVLAEFEIERDQAIKDLEILLNDLVKKGIIIQD
jgi:hypothetical protein